jgi:histidinol dehydrogenase
MFRAAASATPPRWSACWRARAAQVGQIAIVLPPSADGLPDPVSAWVALQYDGTPVLCGNGPAIIAGLALRISGFPAVDMIVGPGGPAVVAAQHLAAEHGVSTGPQFGPTDCTILAGPDADPGLLVADLLTESEHGHTPRLVLIGWARSSRNFSRPSRRIPKVRGSGPVPAW